MAVFLLSLNTFIKMEIAIRSVIVVLAFLTFIPFLKVDHWTVRIWDYPRKQLLFLQMLFITFALITNSISHPYHLLILFAGLISIVYLVNKYIPYTFLHHKQVKKANKFDESYQISIYISNVYMHNTKYELLLKSINKHNPDFIMLVETDEKWKKSLSSLEDEYSHCFFLPKDDTYGMLIYSRFQLEDCQFKFLMDKNIPSFHTNIILKNGEKIRFYGLHPEPPFPTESIDTTERDAELLVVAKEVKKLNMPVLVAGDLNDVAWSYTTKLFQKISGLLDPRIGRGFFSTFHAKYPLARWPLDHIFVSLHFRLIKIKRLASIGSDHFPIFLKLLLKPSSRSNPTQEVADEEDKKIANEKIQAGYDYAK